MLSTYKNSYGARLLREFLKAPLLDKKQIEFRHNLIEVFCLIMIA